MFLNSISGSCEMLILIFVGFLVGRSKLVGENLKVIHGFIPKLLTYIALPSYMITNLTQDFTKNKLILLVPKIWIPVLSMAILYLISLLFVRLFNVPNNHKGTFQSMFFNSNTIFVGLPINMALFGSASLPYVLVYYMANTAIFWSFGAYMISKDGMNSSQKIDIIDTLKKVFSPPMLGFICGVIFVILGIQLPGIFVKDLTYLGNMTTPLAMIFIGLTMSSFSAKSNFKFLSFDNIGVLCGRFLFAPIVTVLLMSLSSGGTLMKDVFLIQAAMPVMTNAPVVAQLYGGDSEYASTLVVESTLLSMFVIPILSFFIR